MSLKLKPNGLEIENCEISPSRNMEGTNISILKTEPNKTGKEKQKIHVILKEWSGFYPASCFSLTLEWVSLMGWYIFLWDSLTCHYDIIIRESKKTNCHTLSSEGP